MSEREKELERVLKAALRQTGCDGDLCYYAWHEEARRLLGEDVDTGGIAIEIKPDELCEGDVRSRSPYSAKPENQCSPMTREEQEKIIHQAAKEGF